MRKYRQGAIMELLIGSLQILGAFPIAFLNMVNSIFIIVLATILISVGFITNTLILIDVGSLLFATAIAIYLLFWLLYVVTKAK
ncbi:MAG: hypothetical protein KatS3mg085_474 [Candidatus Dojkabacteria bacterium]|nr:MAG: hypothetical protein KatS3mg085_474 [Candidatus Dojkabacteria bacterium]